MTITDSDLARKVAEKHEIDLDAALDHVEGYARQIETLDGTTIDRENIHTDEEKAILGAIAAAIEGSTANVLDDVSRAVDALEDAEREVEKAVLKAIKLGAPIRQIAIAGRMSRPTVYRIRDKA
ncbi:hypothetical protein [Corynebacterium cystitidis]|uniref:hypothetical protein n=1 Tax=Corynebacterium cystitidis TaxID=35757 RepID=UPI00211DA8F8|nr:hypothetical protein [Corynebacterium cystitidis]